MEDVAEAQAGAITPFASMRCKQLRIQHARCMIPKSGSRFSEKIMLKQRS
jgi:hypothetical protein